MTILSRSETLSSIYRSAADAMKPIDFPPPEVPEQTNPQQAVCVGDANTEALIAATEKDLLTAIADKFAALRAAARATSPADAPSDAGLNDLVRPMMILQAYDISRAELHRRCVEHPIGTPGGFSLRRDGESSHLISLSRWDRHFAQNPPRRRRSETKKRVK
jgi:hypothetical protein